MKNVLFTLALLTTDLASAQSWKTCYSEDGRSKMEIGRLYVDDVEITSGSFMINKSRTIGSSYETCILAGSNKEVVSNSNTTTIDEVYFSYGDGNTYKINLTCDTGYNDVPENDFCIGAQGGD